MRPLHIGHSGEVVRSVVLSCFISETTHGDSIKFASLKLSVEFYGSNVKTILHYKKVKLSL
jgi:hypothetical protein